MIESKERFEVIRELGSGGMGTVHEVLDRQTNERLALKRLTRFRSLDLLLFKNEFRSLADLRHPNLVGLRELFALEGGWFYTMDLIEGSSFLEYVWNLPRGSLRPGLRAAGAPTVNPDMQRLREVLRQLVLGVHALHQAGKLHRDLKPSNILVTESGHAYLLDFGLVQDLRLQPEMAGITVGTRAYMSPEQSLGKSLTYASDWYSVGVMLHEALTGVCPRFGDTAALGKTDAPEDLATLCRDLLTLKTSARPTAETIFDRLGIELPKREDSGTIATINLVGRTAQLRRLREAFDQVVQGEQQTIHVVGRSGMGKTALVRSFLRGLRGGDTIVLEGRCYERESVPFKALDPVVDALAHRLASMPPRERTTFMPSHLPSAARIFPILGQFLPDLRGGTMPSAKPMDVRRDAFEGLRSLLVLLSRKHRLVVHIDDLQWTDADSLNALELVLRKPAPPALLLLLSLREEALSQNPQLSAFLSPSHGTPTPTAQRIDVGALSRDDSLRLAGEILGDDAPDFEKLASKIAMESNGVPFFVEQLSLRTAAMLMEYDGAQQVEPPGLSQLVAHRVADLSHESRELLQLVAVAARPIAQDVVCRAARVGDKGWESIAALVAQRLVRTDGRGLNDFVECYHDVIREGVVRALDKDALKERHGVLAHELLATKDADPENLYLHFLEAGELTAAAKHLRIAAERAQSALAFDRAARLYGTLIELEPASTSTRDFRLREAECLALAGRGPEAAKCYLELAQVDAGEHAMQLREMAARAFLDTGHLAEGRRLLHEVLAGLGVSVPRSKAGILVSFATLRTKLALRGLESKEAPAPVTQAMLARIDACSMAAQAIGMADPVEGSIYLATALLLALDAGDPRRLARALALEGGYHAVQGPREHDNARALLDRARLIAEQEKDPLLAGLVATVYGIAEFQDGNWTACLNEAENAERSVRTIRGGGWELGTSVVFVLACFGLLGRFPELIDGYHTRLVEAEQRRDLHAETLLRVALTIHPGFVTDEPERVGRDVRMAMDRWMPSQFTLQRCYAQRTLVQLHLYTGDATQALTVGVQAYRQLSRSLMRSVALVRNYLLGTVVSSRLAVAQMQGVAADSIRAIRRDQRELLRNGRGWTDGLAELGDAQLELLQGRRARAARGFRRAAALLDAADMRVHAIAARWRLGELESPNMQQASERWLADRGVSNPRALVGMLAPVTPTAAPQER